jgi:hypothetical protein
MRIRSLSPRPTAAIVLTLGGIAALVVGYPGSLGNDSLTQLVEGREMRYGFWHPPVMSWLLGLADGLVPGAGLYMVLQTLVGFGALVALLWLARRVSWAAVAIAVVAVPLPQLLIYQGIVWKDVLFADAVLASFVALGFAAAHWHRRRWPLLALAGLFLVLAALVRQNGVLLVPVAALALAALAARLEASWRKGAVYGVAFVLAAVLAITLANRGFALRHEGPVAVDSQFKILRTYDITGMVKRHPEAPLRVLEKKAPEFAWLIRHEAVRRYSPSRNDTLQYSEAIQTAESATPLPVLTEQWRSLAAEYPGTWLAQRLEVFSWLFGTEHVKECYPFHVGVQGEAVDLAELGMVPRYDARDARLAAYGWTLADTPVFWHPLYALIAVGALVLLLRRRRPEDYAVAGLLGGALVFTASFFVIGIACDYRYIYVLDLGAIAAAIYLAADWPIKIR